MASIPPDSTLVDKLDAIGARPPLFLVDVGASGGLRETWRRWGSDLHAVGIDALTREVERLRSLERNPNVCYEAVQVVAPDERDSDGAPSTYALHRSAAYLGTVLLSLGAERAAHLKLDEYLALWREVVHGRFRPVPREASFRDVPDPRADPFWMHYQRLFEQSLGLDDVAVSGTRETLDAVLERIGFDRVDVLKIDTDGYELDVLRGGSRTLERDCLMVDVEVQFHGRSSERANVFANIDSFLRRVGFTLLKLDPHSYSRSALPRPFVYPDLPAQTAGGRRRAPRCAPHPKFG